MKGMFCFWDTFYKLGDVRNPFVLIWQSFAILSMLYVLFGALFIWNRRQQHKIVFSGGLSLFLLLGSVGCPILTLVALVQSRMPAVCTEVVDAQNAYFAGLNRFQGLEYFAVVALYFCMIIVFGELLPTVLKRVVEYRLRQRSRSQK